MQRATVDLAGSRLADDAQRLATCGCSKRHILRGLYNCTLRCPRNRAHCRNSFDSPSRGERHRSRHHQWRGVCGTRLGTEPPPASVCRPARAVARAPARVVPLVSTMLTVLHAPRRGRQSRKRRRKSCVMNSTPVWRAFAASRLMSFRICACVVTSSAVVGSSAMMQCGVHDERSRDHDALTLAAGKLVRIGVDHQLRLAADCTSSHDASSTRSRRSACAKARCGSPALRRSVSPHAHAPD